MKKSFVFVALILLFAGMVSAHEVYSGIDRDYEYKEKIVDSKYYPAEHTVYSKTTYVNYDNDKRYSTDFYRHGYSYRSTVDYRDRHYTDDDRHYSDKKSSRKHNDYNKKYYKYKNYDRDSKKYHYEYNSYKKEWKEKGCYDRAPRGKLFYVKCNR